MSCMIATKETVSKVSYFIAMLLNQGYDSFGFSAEESLHEAFEDCRRCGYYEEDLIYDALYRLNYKAYNNRYRIPQEEHSEEIPKNPSLRYWEVLDRKVESFGCCNNHEVVQDWHYKALKGVQFLHYQMAEDATYKEPKVIALDELAQRLAVFIATHTPIYHILEWC